MIGPRWFSRKRALRRHLLPLACLLALGSTAGIAAPAPDAGVDASTAPATAAPSASASREAGRAAAGVGSVAEAAKSQAAAPKTGKKASQPTSKKPTKATKATKATSPNAGTAQTSQLVACDDKGKEIEVVRLTFVHSTVGGMSTALQPAAGGTPEATDTMKSFTNVLNSLFQVALPDKPAKSQDAATDTPDTSPASPAPSARRRKTTSTSNPATSSAQDKAAEKAPAPPACPLVQDLSYGRLLLHGTPTQNLAIKRAIAAFDVAWPQVQLDMWAVQVSGTDDRALSREVRCIRDRTAWTRDAIKKLQNKLKEELIGPVKCGTLPDGLQRRIGVWQEGPMSLNEALILLLLRDTKEQDRVIDDVRSFVASKLGTTPVTAACGPSASAHQVPTVCRNCAPASPPESSPFLRLQAALKTTGSAATCGALVQFWKDYQAVRELPRQALAPACEQMPDAATKCPQISEQENQLDGLVRSRDRIDRVLDTVMDAYAADMQELLFDPLLESIQAKEKTSKDADGVALVGRTRIVVTSGMEASLAPEMASYVETTRPKPFGTDLLNAAFPAKKSDGSAAGLEGIVGGIPQVQAALLVAALLSDTEPRYLKVAPGIGVDVRPVVLPDESAARLTIDARFGVDTQELSTAKRADLWTQPPPASIKSHHIMTDAMVGVFDLFDISSFSIDTTTPQAPYYIPILGRLPILGPAFQIPRKNKTVRHESVILINTVVLPRSTLLTDPF